MGYISDALNRFWSNQGGDDQVNHEPESIHTDPRPEQRLSATGPDIAPPAHRAMPQPDADDQAASASAASNNPGTTGDQGPEPLKFEDRPSAIDIESLATDDRLVAITEPSSAMAEEYRSVRTGILAKWDQRRHLVHTITSATPQEGKTITTLNLGIAFSELHNRRVAVLEADLRLPLFDQMMGLPPLPGLVGLLEGQADLSCAVHRLANDRLHIITAGRKMDNMQAVQLLSSSAMASLIQTLRNSYDHVLIDTPPVIELADAGILGTISDEVLLIARMNRTPRALVEQAIATLTSYNVFIGGLIATDQPRYRHHYSKYGYKFGTDYGHGEAQTYSSQKAA